MMAPMLELDDVTYTWPGSEHHLGPLSAAIPQGQWVGLIGPNGSGKSTLLRLIAAFWRKEHGTIRAAGMDVSRMTSSDRARHMAFVPQSLDTSFDLTVHEVVELGRLHRLSWKDRMGFSGTDSRSLLDRIMEDTGVAEISHRAFTTLSGGEAKRALLACALVQEAPLLLLDEPTAHLDPGHAMKFLNLVRSKVNAGELTVLMAYHDLSTVSLYADSLWVMDHGQLVLQGPPADVLNSKKLREIYDVDLVTVDHPRTHRPLLIFP